MLDSIIAGLVSRSIASTASRAAHSQWVRTIKRSVLRPSTLDASVFEADELAQKRADKIRLFLDSDACFAIVRTYALGSSRTETVTTIEFENSIRETFCESLYSYTGLAEVEISAIAVYLWEHISGAINLTMESLLKEELLEARDLVLLARVAQQPQLGQSPLQSQAEGLHQVLDNARRFASARDLVQQTRTAARRAYRNLEMPHARDRMQSSADALYVKRSLELIDPSSSFAPSRRELFIAPSTVTVPEARFAEPRSVIVGDPGVGKTTLTRRMVARIAQDGLGDSNPGPVVLELKNWPHSGANIVNLIVDQLSRKYQLHASPEQVIDALRLGMLCVIFDAVDEAPDSASRRAASEAIEIFALLYPLAPIVVTSRIIGYHTYALDSTLFSLYRLPEFAENQIESYVRSWFTVSDRSDMGSVEETANRFLNESSHVPELRSNPLLLSLICMSFSTLNYIPKNRPEIYRECSELLFSRWDRVRSVSSKVDHGRKATGLLREIARAMFRSSRRVMTERELNTIVRGYISRVFTDDEVEIQEISEAFLDHCAGRAWILSSVGVSERGDRLFTFTHKTFLEFYVACSIVGENPDPRSLAAAISRLLESSGNEVVAQLAIDECGQNDATRPDLVMRYLLFDSETLELRSPSTSLLSFVIRSLQYLNPAPDLVRAIVRTSLRALGEKGPTWLGKCSTVATHFPREFDQELAKAVQPDSASFLPISARTHLQKGAMEYQAALVQDEDISDAVVRLSQTAPAVLCNRVLNGEIGAGTFVRQLGAGSLIGFRSFDQIVEGPLHQALAEFGHSRFPANGMLGMLRAIESSPECLANTSDFLISALVDAILSIDRHELGVQFGVGKRSDKQIAPGMSLLLAFCIEYCRRVDDGSRGIELWNLLAPDQAVRDIESWSFDLGRNQNLKLNGLWSSFLASTD